MILDALLGTCLFVALVALLSVPFMPKAAKQPKE
jgi:hypothetical protein